MVELNTAGPLRAVNCRPHSFQVEVDSSGFSAYERGGMVTQVKQPKTIAFKPLRAALGEPGEFLLSDYSKVSGRGGLGRMLGGCVCKLNAGERGGGRGQARVVSTAVASSGTAAQPQGDAFPFEMQYLPFSLTNTAQCPPFSSSFFTAAV